MRTTSRGLLAVCVACGVPLLIGCGGDDDSTPATPQAGGWAGPNILFNVSTDGAKVTSQGSPFSVPDLQGNPLPLALQLSFAGTSEELRTTRWPRAAKKSRYFWRIS